jgi:hypothetical protein
VGADFPAVGSNFGPPSSGRIPLLLREGMADMRQTGFPAKVKKLIAERASATGDAADAYCEVWEVCHGAPLRAPPTIVGREVRVVLGVGTRTFRRTG